MTSDVRVRLSTTPAAAAVSTAYNVIDHIQSAPAAHQVAAVAVLFKEFSAVLGISPSELLDKAQRWTADSDTFFKREVKALRDYIQQEVGK